MLLTGAITRFVFLNIGMFLNKNDFYINYVTVSVDEVCKND